MEEPRDDAAVLVAVAERCGLTQEKIARHIGVAQSTVSRWRSGEALIYLWEFRSFSGFLGLDSAACFRMVDAVWNATEAVMSASPVPLDRLATMRAVVRGSDPRTWEQG